MFLSDTLGRDLRWLGTQHIVLVKQPLGPVLVGSAPSSANATPLTTANGSTPAALYSHTILERVKYCFRGTGGAELGFPSSIPAAATGGTCPRGAEA